MGRTNKFISLFVVIAAIALLIPGVTQPVLTLSGSIDKAKLANVAIDEMVSPEAKRNPIVSMAINMLGADKLQGNIQAYHQTRSIYGTAKELFDGGNILVAALILTFSVVIPVFKLLMHLMLLLPWRKFHGIVDSIIVAVSKWSMADVFVMALIVTYLGGNAKGQMGDLVLMNAKLESGFYYFLGYCLFSIASTYLFRPQSRAEKQ